MVRFWGWLSLLLVCSGLVNCVTSPRETTDASPTLNPPDPQKSSYPLLNHPFNMNIAPYERTFLPNSSAYNPLPIHPNRRITEVSVIAVAPTCYDAPNYRVLCLGFIKNPLEQTVEQVVLRVNLMDGLGTIHNTQLVYPEQRYILPGQSAPYRVFFNNVSESRAYVSVEVQHLKSVSYKPPSLSLHIDSGHLRFSERSYGRYQINGTLQNTSETSVSDLWAIATLYDANHRVVGYRVVPIPQTITPDSNIKIDVEIIPQIVQSSFHHTLHIESR